MTEERAPRWLIYGANGYTGQLLAEEAVRRGLRPVLAGRSQEKLEPLGAKLGLPTLAVDLADGPALRQALQGAALVLHAAGPFVHTAAPMVEACLDVRASYLDITGEIPVFEANFARDAAARERGVALMSGVGFDVVPSDCLALHVAHKLAVPSALEIGIDAGSEPSSGTVKSAVEGLQQGCFVRRGGVLQRWRLGRGAREQRFTSGVRKVIPVPWGDLSTAYRSTGIPDITTFMSMPPGGVGLLKVGGPVLVAALGSASIRRAAASWAERRYPGPTEAERNRRRSHLWARAIDREGQAAESWLTTPEGYAFTALSGIRAIERTLEKKPIGAVTPAMAFGADFVLEIEGVKRFDALPD
jgi:short subunit dehydrogenase-like uncharacterized protein